MRVSKLRESIKRTVLKPHFSISFAENEISEIRCRALATIESKLGCCRTNLIDLTVNLDELISSLMKWFRCIPLADEQRVLNILLTILKVN